MSTPNKYRKSTAIGTYRYIHAHHPQAGVRVLGGKKPVKGMPYEVGRRAIKEGIRLRKAYKVAKARLRKRLRRAIMASAFAPVGEALEAAITREITRRSA